MLLYRILLSIFAALYLARGDARARLRPADPQSGPHIWLHGASNGELASARPLLRPMIEARPDLNWLITCNTQTACDMVRGWDLPRVSVRLAPVDLEWVTRRVLKSWDVRGHIALESEIWPHRMLRCVGPVILLGARMSDSTARSWARLGNLPEKVLATVDYASAQDDGSRDHLVDLGLPDAALGPVVDLKAFYTPPDQTPDAPLRAAFERSETWLAASTHEGEEATVLEAHCQALETRPDLKLILAPRHPRRAEELLQLIRQHDLTVAQRSTGDAPEAQVYLADTMGEMALWYQLAGRVFIGGSLTDRGGHTPYEPAAYGCALLHGPDMKNFRAACARLSAKNAARTVETASQLATALGDLAPQDAQEQAGTAARLALQCDVTPEDLVAKLVDHLPEV